MRRALLFLLAALASPGDGARAYERVVAALNQTRISISSDFSGSELFVYGAVAGAAEADPDLGVVIVVSGPERAIELRRKDRVSGVWVNGGRARVSSAPSYYATASTGPYFETISHTENLRHRVSVDRHTEFSDQRMDQETRDAYLEALSRLRVGQGRYVFDEGGVELIDGALFHATFALPADIVEGSYRARVFLTREREVIDMFEDEVSVRKVGVERIVADLAAERPLAYGIAATILALFAGWAASEIFRLMRR